MLLLLLLLLLDELSLFRAAVDDGLSAMLSSGITCSIETLGEREGSTSKLVRIRNNVIRQVATNNRDAATTPGFLS